MAKDGLIILLKVLNTVALIFIAFAVSIYVYYLHRYNEGCAKSSNVENFVETLDLPKEQMFVTTDGSTITPFKFDGTDTLPEIDVQAGGSICIGTGTSASCINKTNINDILTTIGKTKSGTGTASRWGTAPTRITTLPKNFTGTIDVIGSPGTRTTFFVTTDTTKVTNSQALLYKTITVNQSNQEFISVQFSGLEVLAGSTFTGPYTVYWTLQSLTDVIA